VLAPPGDPEMDEKPQEHKPPKVITGFFNKRKEAAFDRKHKAKINLVGNSTALRIQNVVRMGFELKRAQRIRNTRIGIKRHSAAVRIQCIARRYVQKTEVAEIKKNTVNAVNFVIRLTRGFLSRKAIRRKRAALVLQRGGLRAVASALMYAVKSTLEVRHEYKHEEWAGNTLQKYAKGFVARLRMRQHRAMLRRQVSMGFVLLHH